MAKKHGHHGGAWKVAYADFVTAMMALFLVLWLVSQDVKIKKAVERAFTNPFASVTKDSTGLIPNNENFAVKSKDGTFDSSSALELSMLRRLNEELIKSFEQKEEDDANTVKLEITPEGMRITVFDRSRRPVFKTQSAELTPYGEWVFSTLAWQISRYSQFTVELEGHTESGQIPVRADYGDWELSSERATSARRKLIHDGVSPGQIRKVAGYGDTVPMPQTQPEDEINRRVSVMLKVRSSKTS